MALAYLKQNMITGLDEDTPSSPTSKRSGWKCSKGKFSVLLGGNLIVWIIFAVTLMDINVFSMSSTSLPKIPQKLAVSGILYNENNPSAIISNHAYCVGDVVDGYTINRITRTEVEFQKNNRIILRQVR